jgi:type IV pilus assembly protein PilB
VGGNSVDLRVSVLPTLFGESVVLRVLDRTVVQLDLNKIGMDPNTLSRVRKIIRRPNGIVLVTGPTGSGKTTTLYSALNELNEVSTKIITTKTPSVRDLRTPDPRGTPTSTSLSPTASGHFAARPRHHSDGEIRDTKRPIASGSPGTLPALHTNGPRR